jgi:uncharacterized Zn finger protein
MKVDCLNLSFNPTGSTVIAGGNGSGKTSVKTFLEICFGGKDKCPPLPVKIGQKKSLGKLTLDDEGHCVTIEVEVEPDRSVKAVVRQDGGKPFNGPMTMLKTLISRFTFDPFALMKLTGQEQRRVMLDCLGVNFDDLEAQVEKLKEERKVVGRDKNGRERQIASMPEHAGVPVNEVSVAALADELNRANIHNQKVKAFVDAVQEWDRERVEALQEADDLREKLRLAEARVTDAIAGHAKALADAAKLKPIDTAPINKKLFEVDAVNAKVRANKARQALVDQFGQDHDTYVALGEQLDAIEKQKQDRLNAAKCPVKGLEFRDDGVWYEGLPLSQDMESDQMIRSVQLAVALNPKLRAIFIDNGERLLPAKLKELDDWCQANSYQCIMFRAQAEDNEACEFFLTEGKISQ